MSTEGAAGVVGTILTSLRGAASEASTSAALQTSAAIRNAKQRPIQRPYNPIVKDSLPDLRLADLNQFELRDLEITFGVEAAKIATKLRSDYALILTEAFPTPHFTQVEDRLQRAFTEGETTLNVEAEHQSWTRERSQLLQQAADANEATMLKWATRGFSSPPGGMVHEMSMVDRAAQAKIGELSRAAAVAAFGRELDSVREAVERGIELHKFAIISSIEYMREHMNATEFGLDITKNTQAAYDKLRTTTYDYYKYLQASQDWSLEVDRYDAEEINKREVKEDEYQMRAINVVVSALIARSAALQSAASAALNGLRGEARVSGQDTTRIEVE